MNEYKKLPNKSEIFIRATEPSDYTEITSLLSEKDVYSNMLQLPFPPVDMWRERLLKKNPNYFSLTAEILENEELVMVGQISISVFTPLRRRHVAAIGMGVKKEYHRRGIGAKLLESILDMADNWLNIIRVELEVFTDNQGAIALYEKYGFKIEGKLEKFAFRNGKYDDVYKMARIK